MDPDRVGLLVQFRQHLDDSTSEDILSVIAQLQHANYIDIACLKTPRALFQQLYNTHPRLSHKQCQDIAQMPQNAIRERKKKSDQNNATSQSEEILSSNIEDDASDIESNNDKTPITIESLPSDIVSFTFRYLDVVSLCQVQKVHRRFCILARSPSSCVHFGFGDRRSRALFGKWLGKQNDANLTIDLETRDFTNDFYNYKSIERMSLNIDDWKRICDHEYVQEYISAIMESLQSLSRLQYTMHELAAPKIPSLTNLRHFSLHSQITFAEMQTLMNYTPTHNLNTIEMRNCDYTMRLPRDREGSKLLFQFLLPDKQQVYRKSHSTHFLFPFCFLWPYLFALKRYKF